MGARMIVITGCLAAGKSHFARMLSMEAGVPCFIKDTFKIAVCSSVKIVRREASSKFSAVTFDAMMYAAERMLEVNSPFIIEGNFVPAGIKKTDEAGFIRALAEKYSCVPLTYMFTGDAAVLCERFNEREKSPERGDVNKMTGEAALSDFTEWCKNNERFDIGGEKIIVDGTDFNKIDYAWLIERARRYLNIVKTKGEFL